MSGDILDRAFPGSDPELEAIRDRNYSAGINPSSKYFDTKPEDVPQIVYLSDEVEPVEELPTDTSQLYPQARKTLMNLGFTGVNTCAKVILLTSKATSGALDYVNRLIGN